MGLSNDPVGVCVGANAGTPELAGVADPLLPVVISMATVQASLSFSWSRLMSVN
jgi:hypothetical protein